MAHQLRRKKPSHHGIFAFFCLCVLISTFRFTVFTDVSIAADLINLPTTWALANETAKIIDQYPPNPTNLKLDNAVEKQDIGNEAESAAPLVPTTAPATQSTNPSSSTLENSTRRLEETIRLLFSENQDAEFYLAKFPIQNFRFYVYNMTDHPYYWQKAKECVENKISVPENYTRTDYLQELCSFGASICNPTQQSIDKYSSRRLNRNADLVLSQLFEDYDGPLRTYDPRNATLFIVPYPSSSWFLCFGARKAAQKKTSIEHLETALFSSLTYWNQSDPISQQQHVFFQSTEGHLQHLEYSLVATIGTPHKKYGGKHFIIPYVNTNREYQPPNLALQDEAFFKDKNLSLVAVMSSKISGNGAVRQAFMNRSQELLGDEIRGLPIFVSDLEKGRKLASEQETLQMYRQSIFCPYFRGDSPNQKRLFDAILSGCIPVAMAYRWEKDGKNLTSYFVGKVPNHSFLPFAKRSFEGYPDMGIDYSELVVEIDAECGLDCMKPTLEALLNDPDAFQAKQQALVKYAKLFSYGLEHNAFQYVETLAAFLVHARNEVMAKTGTLYHGIK